MNRFLTKRDKSSHRRSKSSEPKIDKVSAFQNSASSPIASISAAYPMPHGKRSPHLILTRTTIHATSANSRPGIHLQHRPLSSSGIFSLFKPTEKHLDKKTEKIDAKKILAIRERLLATGIFGIEDPQIEYALQTKYADGSADRAFEILDLFQESVNGVLKPYDTKIHMLGAENREAVTCYLDALLFAMFARLSSFERLLFKDFDQEPKRRLSTLIRLWVNMLRTGKLIQTDITKHLQEALKSCGWEEAAQLCQQDTSEAFGFITETLELPLLTLEVDLYHEGKVDATDDHKFINERLLEVAIPAEPEDGRSIRLEDCLEEHFNARVEIVREMERRNTLQRMASHSSTTPGLSTVNEMKRVDTMYSHIASEKDEDEQEGSAEHVEDAMPLVNEPISTKLPEAITILRTVEENPGSDADEENSITDSEVIEAQEVPEGRDAKSVSSEFNDEHIKSTSDGRPQTPLTKSLIFSNSSNSSTPTQNRTRSTSFVRRYTISQEEPGQPSVSTDGSSIRSPTRKQSLRKEILMPAWQFFRIIRPLSPIYLHMKPCICERPQKDIVLIENTAWYTKQVPSTDSQVAAHFNSTRPVLGICLKRYAMDSAGRPIRKNTAIDIPLQIALPTFVQDDRASENGALFGNFVLKLQSVVCHRGNSLHSGHYIALAREEYQNKEEDPTVRTLSTDDAPPPEYSADRWLKFDDLARDRVEYVDIEKAMKEEMPYLLFYQVQPIIPDLPADVTDPQVQPPPYKDSNIEMFVQASTPITPNSNRSPFFRQNPSVGYFDSSTTTVNGSTMTTEDSATAADDASKSRVSFSDIERSGTNSDSGRKSFNLPDGERRSSVTYTDTSNNSINTASQPVTPGDEMPSSRLSRAASVFGRRAANKSRPTSHVDEARGGDRISSTFSRISLNLMTKASKEPLLDKTRSGESGSSNIEQSHLTEVVEALRATKEKESATKAVSDVEPGVPAVPAIPSVLSTGLVSPSKVGESFSKKGKKDKGKGSDSTGLEDSTDKQHHHVHHHSHSHSQGGGKEKGKGKGKDKDKDAGGEKEESDRRECVLM